MRLTFLLIFTLGLAFSAVPTGAQEKAPPIQAPETIEEAQEFGLQILSGIPGAVKDVWNTQVVPLWTKMWEVAKSIWDTFVFPWIRSLWEWFLSVFGQEIEKRKPLIEQELQKEKEELKQEIEERIPEPGKTLWERVKGWFGRDKENEGEGAVPVETPVAFTPQQEFLVKPYLVYPADKPIIPTYETAVRSYLTELRSWYLRKVGVTFSMASLKVLRTAENYLTMRCGESSSQKCLLDQNVIEGNWPAYLNKAIHNGVERWEEKTAALIFSAGGGGFAGANLYPNHTGFAIVGDWVLEPISGVENEWGIPCSLSDGWQCAGGVPGGSPAHELGHAFGLPHPDEYQGKSIMKWHGDYPEAGFLPHEAEFLRQSPFFQQSGTPL